MDSPFTCYENFKEANLRQEEVIKIIHDLELEIVILKLQLDWEKQKTRDLEPLV